MISRHALKLVECKAIIITPEFKTSQYAKMVAELCPEIGKRIITYNILQHNIYKAINFKI